MFIVMVNVVRTRLRLKTLLYLAIAVSLSLSVNAIADYWQGRLQVKGVRIAGSIGGMFQNPNDLAVHLVIILPIVVAFIPATRSILLRIVYVLIAVLMTAAVIVTFSRGGFLGLVSGLGFFAFKASQRHRAPVLIIGSIVLVAIMVFAPGGYGSRVATIMDSGDDVTGSSGAREQLLIRSTIVTLRHPILGLGMGNFHYQSIKEQVTHNSYTQVGSELGIPAMLLYTMLIFAPYRKLGEIQLSAKGEYSWFHYMALGLQAGLVAYLVASFFASIAYLWYLYYLIGYGVCLRRLYISTGKTSMSWP
jgi:O-antigen ligase